MEPSKQREAIRLLRNLAAYVMAGGELEYRDPEPRGRKGPDRSARRIISFTVHEVRRFDAIGWALWKRSLRTRREDDEQRSPSG